MSDAFRQHHRAASEALLRAVADDPGRQRILGLGLIETIRLIRVQAHAEQVDVAVVDTELDMATYFEGLALQHLDTDGT